MADFDYDSEFVTSSGQPGRSVTIDSDSPRVTTNLDLIAAAGCTNIVKDVLIYVKYVKAPLAGLAMAVEQMGRATMHWGRVNRLQLDFAGIVRDNHDNTVAFQSLARALLGMCPGVRNLQTDSLAISSSVDGLFALLVAGYASQLREFHGRTGPLPAGVAFNQLERLTLSLRESDGLPPQSVDTGRLRHLQLDSLPLSFSWDMFTSNGSQGIVFPELVSLSIDYVWLALVNPQCLLRLHFPKLQTAKVRCYTYEMLLLFWAVFPTKMDKLEIESSAEQLLTLDDMEIPQVKHIHFTLTGHVVDPEALVAVSRFLRRACCSKKGLTIKSSWADVRPETITCTDLTSLKVHTQVSSDMVLALIEHLQRLQTLEFSDVDTRGMLADVSVAPLDAHEPMEPLSTSLQSLEIMPNRDSSGYDTVALAKYLLVRLPNMKCFSMFRVSKQSLLDFACEYVSLYPHLANASCVF
ncbi:hypothetical protein H4R19_002210 [Coemansia spiralis]|nr:hypothetical protein H4R19_002210 [Coemansia spiralis]